MAETNPIPYKSHYKLNEICSILNIKAYVLRFWESEFPEISPELGANGEKLYTKRDVEAISHIKKLLFEHKYTIEKTKMELLQSYKPSVDEIDNKEDAKIHLDMDMVLKTKQKLNEILSITTHLKKNTNQI
jgi:DNA-binding transcriptional MerR regulator